MASTRRPTAARLALFVFASVLGALGCAACGIFGTGPTYHDPGAEPGPAPHPGRAGRSDQGRGGGGGSTCRRSRAVPPRRSQRAAFVRPLRAHQVVGFLPYWEVGSFTPDYQALTTLAYWAVGLGTDGSIAQNGEGYSTLTSAALGLDIRQAHAAGDRVLLTVFSENPSVIHSIAAHPSTAGPRLARNVAALLSAGDFDGVDLDLEGNSTADRGGFVRFVASFSRTLRSLGPTLVDHVGHLSDVCLGPVGLLRRQGARQIRRRALRHGLRHAGARRRFGDRSADERPLERRHNARRVRLRRARTADRARHPALRLRLPGREPIRRGGNHGDLRSLSPTRRSWLRVTRRNGTP